MTTRTRVPPGCFHQQVFPGKYSLAHFCVLFYLERAERTHLNSTYN